MPKPEAPEQQRDENSRCFLQMEDGIYDLAALTRCFNTALHFLSEESIGVYGAATLKGDEVEMLRRLAGIISDRSAMLVRYYETETIIASEDSEPTRQAA